MIAHRYLFAAITAAFLIWTLFALRADASSPPGEPTQPTETSTSYLPEPVVVTVASPVQALEVASLKRQLKHKSRQLASARRRVHGLTRTLSHTTTTREAIDLACSIYGSCSTLWRRALCESGGYRFAKNPSGASGLFQFLPSTWASTPFGRFSIWSPYANALAAGWMQTHGRGGEWVCQ